jgi:murein DD-endopeptidase MepM/ murein hydrolase activator NlpD
MPVPQVPPVLPTLPDPLLVMEVPFAQSTTTGRYWPIRTVNPRGREIAYLDIHSTQHGDPSRSFFANRDAGARHHCGVDLWGSNGDMVVAVEDGEIVHFYPFYNGVFALIVQCDANLVINYGEVASTSLSAWGLSKGSRVKAGDPIAVIGPSTTGSVMCHFETYLTGTTSNEKWMAGQPVPSRLLNPIAYLVELARSGI